MTNNTQNTYQLLLHTDEEYYRALCALAGDRKLQGVVVDPSATSFLECVRRHGRYAAIPAHNQVLDGIRLVSDALREGAIRLSPQCRDAIREFGSYCWDLSAGDRDKVKKQFDHAMDEIRYFVATVAAPEEAGDRFWAGFVERRV